MKKQNGRNKGLFRGAKGQSYLFPFILIIAAFGRWVQKINK
jgi:hypothetical protein